MILIGSYSSGTCDECEKKILAKQPIYECKWCVPTWWRCTDCKKGAPPAAPVEAFRADTTELPLPFRLGRPQSFRLSHCRNQRTSQQVTVEASRLELSQLKPSHQRLHPLRLSGPKRPPWTGALQKRSSAILPTARC